MVNDGIGCCRIAFPYGLVFVERSDYGLSKLNVRAFQKCTQTVSLARDMSVAPETGELTMRDLADDWRKWSFPERLLAVALVLMLIGLSLSALIAATPLRSVTGLPGV